MRMAGGGYAPASFKSHSDDLCEALATTARRICTEHLDPELVTAFVACRLIPLGKNPGVPPASASVRGG